MNSLAPQFSDPFVGVTSPAPPHWKIRADRYKNLLAAAQNAIRKLEGELAQRDERIDDLERQVDYYRAGRHLRTPCTVDGGEIAYGDPAVVRGPSQAGIRAWVDSATRMNVCARGEAEIRDDWNPARQ